MGQIVPDKVPQSPVTLDEYGAMDMAQRRKIWVDISDITEQQLAAHMEEEKAPQTCAAFLNLLPFQTKLIQARWSGESAWIPLRDADLRIDLCYENPTSHPSPGDILWYPGGFSEPEILFPYGATMFASKLGQLAGNHFLTVVEGREQLHEMGRLVLWEGAQDVLFEKA